MLRLRSTVAAGVGDPGNRLGGGCTRRHARPIPRTRRDRARWRGKLHERLRPRHRGVCATPDGRQPHTRHRAVPQPGRQEVR